MADPVSDAPVVIRAAGLGVEFKAGRKRRRSLREFFIHGSRREPESGGGYWPLRGVSFDIRKGECVGIVGRNGTGKSTLLKLIAGVLMPDEGTVTVDGKVAPLLELRAGFNDQLTGRENVQLVGSLHGMSSRMIEENFERIVEFAGEGVRKDLDKPVRHYSSGMKVRLGFSLIAQLEHPIMLVDEVLAVGDKAFRKQCYDAIEKMLENDRTMVLVSHNEGDLKRFCDRGLYIRDGGLVLDSGIDEALDAYNSDTSAQAEARKKRKKTGDDGRA